MIGVCFVKQLVKHHCSKSWTRPDMAPPGGLKVGQRPDLAQWTRRHCSSLYIYRSGNQHGWDANVRGSSKTEKNFPRILKIKFRNINACYGVSLAWFFKWNFQSLCMRGFTIGQLLKFADIRSRDSAVMRLYNNWQGPVPPSFQCPVAAKLCRVGQKMRPQTHGHNSVKS